MSITVTDLRKSFGSHTVINLPACTFPRGITCLGGPSGCGKTTLSRLLVGLETPDSGKIEGVVGDPVVLFQETRLLPAVTALRNVACVSRDKEALAKAAALLRKLGFSEEDQEKKPAKLSGGMRQRVAIARALLFDHERGGNLVVLDEPFRGLDPSMKEKVAVMIAERFADKVTLLITHEAEDASLLGCDYLSFADLGKNN